MFMQEQQPTPVVEVPPIFITVSDFARMLGMKNRAWYYKHNRDPGIPRTFVGPGGRAVLDYAECVAFAEQFKPKKAS